MSSEKIREEFEVWFAENYPKINREYTAQDCMFKMIAAQAWEQSRELLVLELPRGGYFSGYDNEHMMESRDVREAIEAAGLKVKP